MNLDKLPVNAFDIVLVAVLVAGVLRGRKHGMSEELLGLIKWLAILALLNARLFSEREVKAMENFQNDVYGSNFFPTLHTVQSMVFETSFTGPLIRDYLGFVLIKQTP